MVRLSTRDSRIVGRLFALHAIWSVACAVLIGRLFLLMAFPHPGSTGGSNGRAFPAAVRWRMDAEHFQTRVTDDARGRILFRDGTPWAGGTVSAKPLIGPELRGWIGKPDVWPNAKSPVPEQGRGGLEETFEDELSGVRPGVSGQVTLAGGGKVPASSGRDGQYALAPLRGNDIETTIDSQLQSRAERLLREYGVQHGSIVALSLPDREIQVLASASHERSDALVAVAPGSVFKLVTAAAALETHRVSRRTTILCDGVVHAPHVRMRCWRAHGRLSFVEAIAESCDTAFAQFGIGIGRLALEVQADRFGLGQTGLAAVRGKTPLTAADAGVVFRQGGQDAGLLANTAIGQEDVRMTPLQGALLAATVAEGGRYEPGRLVRRIVPGTGGSAPVVNRSASIRACDSYTAYLLSLGMSRTVHDAKGTLYALHDLPIAAKSGTAELTGGRVNVWIVGYRMAHGQPVSAFAICVENERSDVAHRKALGLARDWVGRGTGGRFGVGG